MMQFGPYALGTTIPEESLVGVNVLSGQLYAVVGEFNEDSTRVPGYCKRQNIDVTGLVLTTVYDGPPLSSNVMVWAKIHD